MEEFILLLKDYDSRLLETGDKQTTIQLRTQSDKDAKRLSQFANEVEIRVKMEVVPKPQTYGGTRTD